MLMGLSQEENIAELLKKDKEAALCLIVSTYKERLYWHIRRLVVSQHDAEDILQETFINVFRFIDGYKGDSKIYTWLYRIATNEAMKFYRKGRGIFSSHEQISEALVGRLYESPEIDPESIETKFQEAILRLPPKQRIVFNMRYYDELSYDEISASLGTKVGALKTNYHYAVESIKKFMTESV